MLKFKDVPQEEMSEVVRLAAEMQHREETRGMEKSATVAAAEEVGISEEYLEKAAQELQIRRIAKAQAKRRRNEAMIGAAVAVAGAVGLGFLLKPPPPMLVPVTGTIERVSQGTIASMVTNSANNSVTISVDGFQPMANGEYFANAAIPGTNLGRYKSMTFNVQGNGLPNIRVDIEAGDQRWKSPNIAVGPTPKQVTLSFKEFQRQQRVGNDWKNVRYRSPKGVERFTLKTGETINNPDAVGTVTLSDFVLK